MKIKILRPEYVGQLPDQLAEGVLYVCKEFELTAHKCCCGCGEDVYLKIGPAKWQLSTTSNGRITLYPSVGNWKYACKSHYWIEKNRVIDAGQMEEYEIEAVQRRDRRDRKRYIAKANAKSEQERSVWGRIRSIAVSVFLRIKADRS